MEDFGGAVGAGGRGVAGGFAESFRGALLAERKDDKLVVALGHEALRDLIESSDRNAVLKRLHEQAIVELNGH